MRHKKSEERVKLLHPKVRDEVKSLIEKVELGLPQHIAVAVPQGLRTIDEQNALYAQGRTKAGPIVTNAKGGSSYHNYGLAFDFCIVVDTDKNGVYDETSWDGNGEVNGLLLKTILICKKHLVIPGRSYLKSITRKTS